MRSEGYGSWACLSVCPYVRYSLSHFTNEQSCYKQTFISDQFSDFVTISDFVTTAAQIYNILCFFDLTVLPAARVSLPADATDGVEKYPTAISNRTRPTAIML